VDFVVLVLSLLGSLFRLLLSLCELSGAASGMGTASGSDGLPYCVQQLVSTAQRKAFCQPTRERKW